MRRKARKIENTKNLTGNKHITEIPLSSLESELLSLTGTIVVTGIEGVKELGVTSPTEKKMQSPQTPRSRSPPHPQPTSKKQCHSPSSSTRSFISVSPTSSAPPRAIHKKTQPSLLKTIQDFTTSMAAHPQTKNQEVESSNKILKEINDNIKELVDIQRKRYELELITFELKYPKVEISLEEDSE